MTVPRFTSDSVDGLKAYRSRNKLTSKREKSNRIYNLEQVGHFHMEFLVDSWIISK